MEDSIARKSPYSEYFSLTTGRPTLKMGSPYRCVTGKEDVSVRTIELFHAVTSCVLRGLIFLWSVHWVENEK
jgi:hypothetical protein